MEVITLLGEDTGSGAYLLHIVVSEDLLVRFGRFQQGQFIPVPKGEYVYIGSAMAVKGSMTLARRLLRHATRTDPKRPQPIRKHLLSVLRAVGMGPVKLQPPGTKTLFWNIDYLLEQEASSLAHIIILRSSTQLEDKIAHYLQAQQCCRVLAEGLGAHDKPGQTHLLEVKSSASWWEQLPQVLAELAA